MSDPMLDPHSPPIQPVPALPPALPVSSPTVTVQPIIAAAPPAVPPASIFPPDLPPTDNTPKWALTGEQIAFLAAAAGELWPSLKKFWPHIIAAMLFVGGLGTTLGRVTAPVPVPVVMPPPVVAPVTPPKPPVDVPVVTKPVTPPAVVDPRKFQLVFVANVATLTDVAKVMADDTFKKRMADVAIPCSVEVLGEGQKYVFVGPATIPPLIVVLPPPAVVLRERDADVAAAQMGDVAAVLSFVNSNLRVK